MSDSADFRNAIRGWAVSSDSNVHPCNCVGPQHPDPVCPCRMARLVIKDGRYVEIIDHGPVPLNLPSEKGDRE